MLVGSSSLPQPDQLPENRSTLASDLDDIDNLLSGRVTNAWNSLRARDAVTDNMVSSYFVDSFCPAEGPLGPFINIRGENNKTCTQTNFEEAVENGNPDLTSFIGEHGYNAVGVAFGGFGSTGPLGVNPSLPLVGEVGPINASSVLINAIPASDLSLIHI